MLEVTVRTLQKSAVIKQKIDDVTIFNGVITIQSSIQIYAKTIKKPYILIAVKSTVKIHALFKTNHNNAPISSWYDRKIYC